MMDTFDDRLDEAAQALGDRLPALDASLDDAVMAAVRRRAAPALRPEQTRVPSRGWRWLLEPRRVQVRPVWLGAGLAAAAALVIWLASGRPQPGPDTAAGLRLADTVYVHFSLAAPTARDVALAGSFNGWDMGQLHLRRTGDGTWEATIPLPVGEHRYQFVVDGQRWVPDPSAPAQVDDGFGGINSVIVVGPKGVVRS